MQHKPKQKNYLLSFLITLAFWLGTGFIFLTIPPKSLLIIGLFVILLFLALFFTLSLITASSKYGFLISIGLTLILILKKTGQATPLNLFLLLIIIIILNLLFKKRQ